MYTFMEMSLTVTLGSLSFMRFSTSETMRIHVFGHTLTFNYRE